MIEKFSKCEIKEYQSFYNLFINWFEEIVNSFIKYKGARISNGPIEGRNSLVKKILKISNGYSNFKRFRNRAMYCLNKYASHSFKKNK